MALVEAHVPCHASLWSSSLFSVLPFPQREPVKVSPLSNLQSFPSLFLIKLFHPSEQDNIHPSKIPPPFSLLYSYYDLSFIFFFHIYLFSLFQLSLSLSLSLSLHLLPLVCPLLDFIIFSGVLIGNLSACRPLFVLEP